MGVFSYEGEVPSVIPPARLFKAFALDGDNLMIKIAPQNFKNVELIEGDGGPGSIKKITFVVEGSVKYGKHKIEAIDKENFTYCYSIIEGDHLTNIVEKITNEIKLVASPDGGSICKMTSKVQTVGDVEFTEEQLKAGKEKRVGMLKAIEGYLLANPDAYN